MEEIDKLGNKKDYLVFPGIMSHRYFVTVINGLLCELLLVKIIKTCIG